MGFPRWLVLALIIAPIFSLANSALAQLSGRIFPYTAPVLIDPDEITTADVQHALIWTRHYVSMVDGAAGPLTRRAINSWQTSKGFPPTDALTDAQAVALIADGLKLRDAYRWAILLDDAIGFSVGFPAALSELLAPVWEDGAWWYKSKDDAVFQHVVFVLPQDNACASMDGFFAGLLSTRNEDREVDYSARKDDWFVITGRAGNKRFYTRAQCRYSGVVTVIDNIPLQQADAFSFLFTAMANSLTLRPVLNVRAKPQPRIEYPAPSPRMTASIARQPQPAIKPALSDIDRTGKASTVRLALSDGTEMRAQDIFERVAGAVFVVQTDDKQGSAVAINDRELLTNCHVVAAQTGLYLEREGRRTTASLVSADADADRCVLRSETVLSKWVRLRPYADTRVGERVFTVGAPEGLELSIAEGIVSSKRNLNGYRYLQTTAPISPGSSGGGLFDAQGNLLGITTFIRKDGQNLNFAIPAEEYAR